MRADAALLLLALVCGLPVEARSDTPEPPAPPARVPHGGRRVAAVEKPSARWGGAFLDLQLGQSAPARSDLSIRQPDLGNDYKIQRISFRDESGVNPLWFSVRAGYWLQHPSWLGLALELVHPKLYARTWETRRLSGIRGGVPVDSTLGVDAAVQRFDISHGENYLSLELLIRHSLLKPPERPSVGWKPVPSAGRPKGLARPAGTNPYGRGSLHAYAGVGAGPVILHPENQVEGARNKPSYDIGGPGWQAFAGLRAVPWTRVGLLVEYKWTGADLKVRLGSGTARLKERTSHISGGITVG